jgi:hypothetical protein
MTGKRGFVMAQVPSWPLTSVWRCWRFPLVGPTEVLQVKNSQDPTGGRWGKVYMQWFDIIIIGDGSYTLRMAPAKFWCQSQYHGIHTQFTQKDDGNYVKIYLSIILWLITYHYNIIIIIDSVWMSIRWFGGGKGAFLASIFPIETGVKKLRSLSFPTTFIRRCPTPPSSVCWFANIMN